MMCGGVYNDKNEMFAWLRIHPTLNFCRIVYMLSDLCAWSQCAGSYESMPPETMACLKSLWANAVVYMILALYANEIVP